RGDVGERSSAARMAHRRPRVHSRPRRTAAHLLHRSKRSDLRRTSSDETVVRGEGGGGSRGTVSPPAEAGGLGFYWCAANCFMNASLRSFISAGVRSSLCGAVRPGEPGGAGEGPERPPPHRYCLCPVPPRAS